MNKAAKKFTALLLILVLAAGLWMTGCSSADEDADNQLKKDVYDLYESLQTVIADADSGYDVTGYLYDWGETNGFVRNFGEDDRLHAVRVAHADGNGFGRISRFVKEQVQFCNSGSIRLSSQRDRYF